MRIGSRTLVPPTTPDDQRPLAAARESEEQAFQAERPWGLTHVAEMGYSAAFLAAAWLESGDLEGRPRRSSAPRQAAALPTLPDSVA